MKILVKAINGVKFIEGKDFDNLMEVLGVIRNKYDIETEIVNFMVDYTKEPTITHTPLMNRWTRLFKDRAEDQAVLSEITRSYNEVLEGLKEKYEKKNIVIGYYGNKYSLEEGNCDTCDLRRRCPVTYPISCEKIMDCYNTMAPSNWKIIPPLS